MGKRLGGHRKSGPYGVTRNVWPLPGIEHDGFGYFRKFKTWSWTRKLDYV
jgi:hypothetical protein